jgi:heme oxygenase
MTQIAVGIMDRLRDGTRTHHDAAEGHEFQQAFFAGKLPKRAYTGYLGQMYHVYTALENALRDLIKVRPEVTEVVQPHCFRADDLKSDLAFLGSSTDAEKPLPATLALIERIKQDAAAHPAGLLGMHYVVEGSNNGNRHIARNLIRAYELPPGKGIAFLDPYGEEQRPKWQQYKDALGKLPISLQESDVMLASAQEMFRGIGRISSELHAATSA